MEGDGSSAALTAMKCADVPFDAAQVSLIAQNIREMVIDVSASRISY